MKTLRDILGKPVLFHTVYYQGKNGISTSPTGYLSNDPLVIGKQLTAMQNLGGDGCGVVALTYGPTVSSFIHGAVMEASRQCNDRQMPFALCFDPWTVKTATDKNAAMIAALKNPDIQTILDQPYYLAGKPVLDFNTGCTPSTVLASVPGIQYWMLNVDFSWIYIPDPLTPLKKYNALPTMKLPAVSTEFNDGTGPNRNMSVWNQSSPARIVPSDGGKTFHDMADLIPASCQYVQIVTWNDVLEGTDIEKFASMLGGRII